METEELKARQEELTKIRRLLGVDGFEWLVGMCNQQVQARVSELVLTPPAGVDDMVRRAYVLGECSGIRVAMGLPGIQMEVLTQEIKAAAGENEREY